jgi:CDGSH-type Zn-finger protein
MDETDKSAPAAGVRIVVKKNGPYLVQGNVPLVAKTQVVSEQGEPLTWKKEGRIETTGEYALCRCGGSGNKPFCDGTHRKVGFDGTEEADTAPTADRQFAFEGGTRLIVKKDPALCMDSGFCGLRKAGIAHYVAASSDTEARSVAMAMVERCPSGALTYRIAAGEADIETDLPQQIADTTEITSDGPIAGPLWVTGGIPIERSDGQPMETRNRVTLCNCGLSGIKPLCDGTHRHEAQRQARRRKLGGR